MLALLNPVRLMMAGTVSPDSRRALISSTFSSVSSRLRGRLVVDKHFLYRYKK
jgi:hypothetical protein